MKFDHRFVRNAGRLMQEGGAGAVKLEGGVHMAETVRRIVQIGIPVVGHIGLTPQSVNQLSGYKVQGRTPEAAERLLEDAIALQQAVRDEQLIRALTTSRTIGKAIGLVMERHGLDEDAPYQHLVDVSHDTHVKLRLVATRMVNESNELHRERAS